MTAKEWLNRGRALNKTIEGLEKAKARAYDIAVGTAAERRAYSQFRKFLIKDGFLMMQESVYSKLALNPTVANSI